MDIKLFLSAVLLFALAAVFTCSSQTRPVQDSIGFCWDANEMNTLMDYLSSQNETHAPDEKNLVAAISVHDDYLYAGNVYYPLYRNIKTKEVVIFGVTHGTVRKELGPQSDVIILDDFSKWHGPYKDVGISPLREIIKSKLPVEYYKVSDKAHSIEHSIEAEIPFLQFYNRDIKITPVMVTQMSYERMKDISTRLADIIRDYMKANNLQAGKDIFFLISNDANHYGADFNNSPYGLDKKAHDLATANDKKIISADLDGKLTEEKIRKTARDLWPDSTRNDIPLWCGRYPVVMGLQTIKMVLDPSGSKNITGRLFRYSDTFTEKVLPVKNTGMGITAVFSYKHWCGWFTEGYYLEDN